MITVVADRKVRFGKPVVSGTRITVDEVLGALASGMTYKEIEEEYGVTRSGILAVLKYAAEVISEENVGMMSVKK